MSPCSHSARTFFDLGLNLGRMLSMSSGVAVVRATAQLLAEFEYYVSEDGSLQDWVHHALRLHQVTLELHARWARAWGRVGLRVQAYAR